jgi:hypothetical protein
MKGVWCEAMHAWRSGRMDGSVGPRMGAGRRAQVGKVGVEEERIRDSARAWGCV